MRASALTVAAVLGAALFAASAAAVPPVGAGGGTTVRTGFWATASATATSVSLRLHYPMTCGQAGPGPLVVGLPAAFSIGDLRALVRGRPMPATAAGTTATVQLPKPPRGISCMSIVEGVLPVTLDGVATSPGTYTVTARLRSRAFTAQLRVP